MKLQGNEFYKKKDFEKAIEFYDKAISLNPVEPLYYNNKAACFIEKKEYDRAIEECDKAFKIMEENHINDFSKKAKLYARKAKGYHLKKDYEQAIAFYERSLLEDHNASVKDDLRRAQREKKQQDELSYLNPEIAEQNNVKGGEYFKSGK